MPESLGAGVKFAVVSYCAEAIARIIPRVLPGALLLAVRGEKITYRNDL